MKYSVSSLSYVGPKMKWMSRLPLDLGIEIFWDWGAEDYYNALLPQLMQGRTGAFSIHGPMSYSFADSCPDDVLFSQLMRPFDLYHRFNSQFYVLHTHTNLAISPDPSGEELQQKRERSVDRINRFDELCRKEGVQLVIENIGKRADGVTMFDEEAFLDLFRQNSHLRCLLDLGHAVLGDYDISRIQDQLQHRLMAYHVHDNRGTRDDHLRMGDGVIDWSAWVRNCRTSTPDAEVVFEYDGIPDEMIYDRDRNWIELA